ncbi:MAG: PhoU domain-containing protein [Butyricicoccaceae bacterium]
MGALCENAIASAVKSLIDGDTKLAAAAIRIDHEIDRKETRDRIHVASNCCFSSSRSRATCV